MDLSLSNLQILSTVCMEQNYFLSMVFFNTFLCFSLGYGLHRFGYQYMENKKQTGNVNKSGGKARAKLALASNFWQDNA